MNSAHKERSGSSPVMILACSGAADVGALADQAARILMRDGKGKMYCLAGVGGHVPGFMETIQSAEGLLILDGCGLSCAKRVLDRAGVKTPACLNLHDLGMEKGKSPLTAENIHKVVARATEMLER